MLVALAGSSGAQADGAKPYPSKPITLVVPFLAGGGTDAAARLLAKHIGEELSQNVVTENKPGANTSIATSHVMKAPADGHTLLFATISTLVLNPSLYEKLPYDPEKNLDVISILAMVPLVMLVPDASPAKDLDSFVTYAKTSGRLNYAGVGLGGSNHLTTELIRHTAGVDLTNVPYHSSAPAMIDLQANRLDLLVESSSYSIAQLAGGRVRAIAVTSPARLPGLPNVPALSEKYPGLVAMPWYALVVPKGLPADVRAALKRAVDKTLQTPAYRTGVEKSGLLPGNPQSDAEISSFVSEERKQWSSLIKKLGLRLDK